MAMLTVENINVYYGVIHALKDISFQVNEGEIVALIGANGAGKTTTLQTVSGMLSAKSGSIRFQDQEISRMPEHKIVKQEINNSLEMVYERFPRLKERTRQLAGTLSGGEQQMLAMGRALMANPRILLLDEPSMGLSPLLVSEIFDIIQEINKQGVTILLVEQNAKKALSIANRAYVLETGRIVKENDAQALLHDEAIKKAYLGE